MKDNAKEQLNILFGAGNIKDTTILHITAEKYREIRDKSYLLDEIIELMKQYQFEERTAPGSRTEHNNRCRLLVHDIEWAMKKELGPTVEECPYAE